jgi:hypothetical protein
VGEGVLDPSEHTGCMGVLMAPTILGVVVMTVGVPGTLMSVHLASSVHALSTELHQHVARHLINRGGLVALADTGHY